MSTKILRAILALTLLVTAGAVSFAQTNLKSKGIGMRWGFWNMGNRSNLITYRHQDGREIIETAGLGGWLYFVSRAGDRYTFEFALGAFAQADGQFSDGFGHDEDYEGMIVIPILLGVQRDFLSADNSSALRPYISLGAGPYWITNVKGRERSNSEEVISTMKPGGYLGGGMNFFLFNSFAINFDVKYHAVDLELNSDISGLEMALGITIMWGQYKTQRN